MNIALKNELLLSNIPIEGLDSAMRDRMAKVFVSFLDTATTATGKATYYNSSAEQEAAIKNVHDVLFAVDRGIYTLALLLPGVMDKAKQEGLVRLLSAVRQGDSLVGVEQENGAILHLVTELPPQRKLNLFLELKKERVNNARTRKLILRTLLTGSRLELWAVKYRQKMRKALEHAWGKRTTSILAAILKKEQRTEREKRIVRENILRYLNDSDMKKELIVLECVGFILGNEERLKVKLPRAFVEAKRELCKGVKLPFEILEGIRSRYHPKVESAQVLAMTRENLTDTQKIRLQAKAARDSVEVTFDPMQHDAVQLYVYAYKQGMTGEIKAALAEKAKKTAEGLPFVIGRAAVLIDASGSMRGSEERFMHPIAVSLALRDTLEAAGVDVVTCCSGNAQADRFGLVHPGGDTSLAMELVNLLEKNPEVIFILSDGYENTPAGRVDEVLRTAENIGFSTPVIQISPVMSARSMAVKALSDKIAVLPVQKPEGLGLGMLRALFMLDLEKALQLLLGVGASKLGITGSQDTVCLLRGGR